MTVQLRKSGDIFVGFRSDKRFVPRRSLVVNADGTETARLGALYRDVYVLEHNGLSSGIPHAASR